jgi:hypothetical protein
MVDALTLPSMCLYSAILHLLTLMYRFSHISTQKSSHRSHTTTTTTTTTAHTHNRHHPHHSQLSHTPPTHTHTHTATATTTTTITTTTAHLTLAQVRSRAMRVCRRVSRQAPRESSSTPPPVTGQHARATQGSPVLSQGPGHGLCGCYAVVGGKRDPNSCMFAPPPSSTVTMFHSAFLCSSRWPCCVPRCSTRCPCRVLR